MVELADANLIFFSRFQVDTSWDSGDREGAQRNSRITLLLNIASIVGGIISITAMILLLHYKYYYV